MINAQRPTRNHLNSAFSSSFACHAGALAQAGHSGVVIATVATSARLR